MTTKLIFVTLSILLQHGSAQAKPPALKEVQQVFEELVAAAQSLEVERYMTFFDQQRFVGLNAMGQVWHSAEAFKTEYAAQIQSVQRYESLQFDKVALRLVDEKTVVLVNEFAATVRLKNGEQVTSAGGGTQVWSKQTGRWLLVSVSSSIKPTIESKGQ